MPSPRGLCIAAGGVRVTLAGEATVPLKLYVFRDVGDGVEHRYEEVEPSHGGQEVRFTAPPGSR